MTNVTFAFDSSFVEGDSLALPRWFLTLFILVSIIESVLGIVGNTLVIIVISCVTKSNILHRSHNCFIVNLALSDLVLCLVTMPLNTYRSSTLYARFSPTFCKLANSFPAINICVSSLTIVAISIYRYVVVCYPHRKIIGTCSTVLIMIGIWLLAIGAASPLFVYSRLSRVYDDALLDMMVQMFCTNHSITDSCRDDHSLVYRSVHVCHESWPQHEDWRLFYTIFMFLLQFILPISIICITYYRIMVKLRERRDKEYVLLLSLLVACQNAPRSTEFKKCATLDMEYRDENNHGRSFSLSPSDEHDDVVSFDY